MGPGRVRVLPEDVKNQIAAGEVVERPASVIKELVENALDAGARKIKVEVLGGGVELLSVEDDGHGMPPEDARLALVRHATSKLREARDLERVSTLGFRGEALPAIASVSRFTLRTATEGAPEGLELRVEGGGEAVETAAPPVVGTSVQVSDLFFNTPARRKFLKRPTTELGHVTDVVTRLALARPEVAFKLVAEGRHVLDAPRQDSDAREELVRARLRRLLGRAQADSLVPLAAERIGRGIRIEGWIGRPPASERGPRGLHVFVNARFVRERTLMQAVQEAYRGRLPKGRQPVVVLFLELDPGDVDVNVHPQKTEVRFARPGEVFRAVQSRLRRGLAEAGLHVPDPEASPEARRRALNLAVHRAELERDVHRGAADLPPGPAPEPSRSSRPDAATPAGADHVRDRSSSEAYRGHARRLRQAYAARPMGSTEGKRVAQWLEPSPRGSREPPVIGSRSPAVERTEAAEQLGLRLPRTPLTAARRLGVALGRWAVLEAEGALWLVDLPAARSLAAAAKAELGSPQPLLMPRRLSLADPARVVGEFGARLAEVGFELAAREGELVLLTAPEGLDAEKLELFVEVAIEAARDDRPIKEALEAELGLEPGRSREGPVREEEVGPLLKALEETLDGQSAHEGPIVVSLSARQLAQLFGSGR